MSDEIKDQDILELIEEYLGYNIDIKSEGQTVRKAFVDNGKDLSLEEAIGLWFDFCLSDMCAGWLTPWKDHNMLFRAVMQYADNKRKRPKTYDDYNWSERIKCL